MFVNVYQVGLATIIYSYNTTICKKSVPNCDVSFANGELHQAYGHVTLTMSAWPKYGHMQTYQRPMTVFWSRTHRQRHMTICLMKFAIGERNVAIRYRFLCIAVLYQYIIFAPTKLSSS